MDAEAIETILEVQRVMSRYERYYDKKVLDPLVDLFTADCEVRYDVFGDLDGRGEVRSFLEDYFAGETEVEDSFHMLANPWIEPEGDQAVGRWHFFGAYTLKEVGAAWLIGFYEVRFVRDGGRWRIHHLDWEAKYITPFDEGWEETPMALSSGEE